MFPSSNLNWVFHASSNTYLFSIFIGRFSPVVCILVGLMFLICPIHYCRVDTSENLKYKFDRKTIILKWIKFSNWDVIHIGKWLFCPTQNLHIQRDSDYMVQPKSHRETVNPHRTKVVLFGIIRKNVLMLLHFLWGLFVLSHYGIYYKELEDIILSTGVFSSVEL